MRTWQTTTRSMPPANRRQADRRAPQARIAGGTPAEALGILRNGVRAAIGRLNTLFRCGYPLRAVAGPRVCGRRAPPPRPHRRGCRLIAYAVSTLLLCAGPACADELRVAVAANFAAPAKLLAAEFDRATGHQTRLAFGATGTLFAQIAQGAPFDVLLAADEEIPARLERDGAAVAGSRFTYATGRLVLWSAKPGYVDDKGQVLANGDYRHLAIANPRLAPYGAAAAEVLRALKLTDLVRPKLVQAENIAQAYQFVATGNAELGFVALSQVMPGGRLAEGSAWIVPTTLHRPIRQDAVLLERGKGKPAAAAWLEYLKGIKAKAIIRSFGYEI